MSATISLIAAVSTNWVIGKNNQLPWRIPADMKRFKKLTTGKTVIMGRKTHESIGKPLANRQNIVITHQSNYKAEGCLIAHDIKSALEMAEKDIFIIGGEQIYQLFMPLVERVYLTIVYAEVEGDAFLCGFYPAEWELRFGTSYVPGRIAPDNHEFQYTHSFRVYDRKKDNENDRSKLVL